MVERARALASGPVSFFAAWLVELARTSLGQIPNRQVRSHIGISVLILCLGRTDSTHSGPVRKDAAATDSLQAGTTIRLALPWPSASGDCKTLAYTVDRIAKRAPFASEFLAVTDIVLQPGNDRHQLVGSTLRDAGIESVPREGLAVWVAKLRPLSAVRGFS